MKRLWVVGAGAFGRELLAWLRDVPAAQRTWEIAGFLDPNPTALEGYPCDLSIMGEECSFPFSDDDVFICALGNPEKKLRACRLLKSRGAAFVTLIHPTAVVGPCCSVGEGSILCPGTILTTNVTLGNFVTVNLHSTLAHDVVVGDGSTLSSHCDVTGRAKLGEGVFMGTHAAVLPGVVVGDYATVGAGSVAFQKVRPRTTVMGVPAREVFSSERRV
jgi:sugar O-acyltransferase (sialic acid O-acetyltransferase NeuD family)